MKQGSSEVIAASAARARVANAHLDGRSARLFLRLRAFSSSFPDRPAHSSTMANATVPRRVAPAAAPKPVVRQQPLRARPPIANAPCRSLLLSQTALTTTDPRNLL